MQVVMMNWILVLRQFKPNLWNESNQIETLHQLNPKRIGVEGQSLLKRKKNSYGFTLQTYGIHYRKEQEIEMITYVDSVEYDGPAYRAGMREGDVILSINGIDMEKADHKTLVEIIKKCDNRMRMVVLFEDCVRKVALHMRYIHLQNKLQDKISELEKACLQERQLLSGKWKTHSLPARKKGTVAGISTGSIQDNETTNEDEVQLPILYRPAISTEDVVNVGSSRSQQLLIQQQQRRQSQQTDQQQVVVQQPSDQYIVTYQYIDPHYRYVLKPSTSNSSGEYFISVGPQRSPTECHYILTRDGADIFRNIDHQTNDRIMHQAFQSQQTTKQPQQQQQQQIQVPPCSTCDHATVSSNSAVMQQNEDPSVKLKHDHPNRNSSTRKSSVKQHCHGHSCNPCLGRRKSFDKTNGGEDNTSLDAYDLASSPCCAAHCVPTRRRSRNSKEHHHHHHKHKHRDKDGKERQRPRSQSHASPDVTGAGGSGTGSNNPTSTHHHHHHHHVQPSNSAQSQSQQQQHQCLQNQHSVASNSSRSKYFNLSANLASHCSLHSCTSSDFVPGDSASYTTSLSTDTLYWDPQSEGNSRQPSTKSRQSTLQQATGQSAQHQMQITQASGQKSHQFTQQGSTIYQQRYTACLRPAQIQPIHQIYQTPVCVSKPKSWDNLTTKAFGGYGFGYGYLDTVGPKPALKIQIGGRDSNNSNTGSISNTSSTGNTKENNGTNETSNNSHQQSQQQLQSLTRKNPPYGRYSTYADVENYAPPPSQFVEEIVTVFVKKTEETVTEKCIPNQSNHHQLAQVTSGVNMCNNSGGNSNNTNPSTNNNSNKKC